MRTKTRSVLRDVTPGNTPQSKRTTSKAVKAKQQLLSPSPARIPALDLSGVHDAGEDSLPQAPMLKRTASAGPPKRIPVLPSQTTPLANKSSAAPDKTRGKVPFSPLPPSSPPSETSEVYDDNAENRPPPGGWVEAEEQVLEEIVEEDEEEVRETLEAPSQPAQRLAASSSSDDPFGFSALERRLKVEREVRRRAGLDEMPKPHLRDKGKGKATTRPPRTPFGELSLPEAEPAPSTSAAARRAPTPYHPSDDLEDMYLDVAQQPTPGSSEPDEETQATLVGGRATQPHHIHAREDTQRTYVEGLDDAEEIAPPVETQPSAPSQDDEGLVMPPTPKPQHVAYMPGLASPFSSSREGTPCDRSLVDSPLSSPSPTKPLTINRALVFSSPGKSTGRPRPLSETPLRTPLTFNRLKHDLSQLGTSSPLRARSTAKKAGLWKQTPEGTDSVEEDPLAAGRRLENLLPKRPFRRSGLAASSLPPDTSSVLSAKSTKAKGKEVARPAARARGVSRRLGREYESASSGSETELPIATSPSPQRKRKAPLRQFSPSKRMKVEVVITKRPPPPDSKAPKSRGKASGRKPASRVSKPQNKPRSKGKDKGKGKQKEGVAKVGDEDSDQARARQARIEYFRSLDGYSLAKENVYVV